jgi:hypothetical protein
VVGFSFAGTHRFLPLCNPCLEYCLPFFVAARFFLLAAASFALPAFELLSFFIVFAGAYTSPVSEDFLPDAVVHFCPVHRLSDFCDFFNGISCDNLHLLLYIASQAFGLYGQTTDLLDLPLIQT